MLWLRIFWRFSPCNEALQELFVSALAGALLLEHRDSEAAYLLYYGSFMGEILTSGPKHVVLLLGVVPLKQLCHHFYQFHRALSDTKTRGHMLHAVHGWTEGNPTLGSLRDKLGEAIKDDTVSSKTLHTFCDKLPLSDNPHHGKTIKLCIQNSDDGTVYEVFRSYNHVRLSWILRVYSAEKVLSKKHWCIHRGKTLFVKSARVSRKLSDALRFKHLTPLEYIFRHKDTGTTRHS